MKIRFFKIRLAYFVFVLLLWQVQCSIQLFGGNIYRLPEPVWQRSFSLANAIFGVVRWPMKRSLTPELRWRMRSRRLLCPRLVFTLLTRRRHRAYDHTIKWQCRKEKQLTLRPRRVNKRVDTQRSGETGRHRCLDCSWSTYQWLALAAVSVSRQNDSIWFLP